MAPAPQAPARGKVATGLPGPHGPAMRRRQGRQLLLRRLVEHLERGDHTLTLGEWAELLWAAHSEHVGPRRAPTPAEVRSRKGRVILLARRPRKRRDRCLTGVARRVTQTR